MPYQRLRPRTARAWRVAASAALALPLLLGGARQATAGSPRHSLGIGDPSFPGLGNRGYDAQHYDLDLNVDLARGRLGGVVTMQARATDRLLSLSLDLAGFAVARTTIDGQPAQFSRRGEKLEITPPAPILAGAQFSVAISYSGTPGGLRAAGIPLQEGWNAFGRGVYVASETSGAHTWFPVNDHPLDKATYTLRITVPNPYLVAANGLLAATVRHTHTTTFVWEERWPLASYLATVNIGRFTVQTRRGPDGLPIRDYVPTALAARARRVFADQPAMIAYFQQILGPYPFEAYGGVIADADFDWALETQTLSLFSRRLLTVLGTAPDPAHRSAEVVAHELAHQWFGDSVSLRRWRDIWLAEGFATYTSWLWLDHREQGLLAGRVRIWYNRFRQVPVLAALLQNHDLAPKQVLALVRTLLQRGGAAASDADALAFADADSLAELTASKALGALHLDPASAEARWILAMADHSAPATPPAADLFNDGVYYRGALTLHALRLHVGDAAFFRILRAYASTYRHGNADIGQFIVVAEHTSGRPVGAFLHPWLYGRQVPELQGL